MMSKIYIVGSPDDADFAAVARALRERDWDVRNLPGDLDKDLRHQLGVFLECQAVCFLDTWWTSEAGVALSHIASWTRTPFIHPTTMERVPSARG